MAKATHSAKTGKKGSAAKSGQKKTAEKPAKGASKSKSATKSAPSKKTATAKAAKTAKAVPRPKKPAEAATPTPKPVELPVESHEALPALVTPEAKPKETEQTPQPPVSKVVQPESLQPKPVPEPATAAAASESAIAAVEVEPEAVSELDGVRLPAARGRVGVFGGPRDHSAKPDDKLALPTGRHFQYERIRSLDARGYYCAMRWDYRQKHMSPEEGKRWFANKKILVTNPTNGKAVVVRAVDYGPHENTGLAISVSPGAAEVIEVNVGDEVTMVFADQKSTLGPFSGD
jgi:hypothetical protein